MERQEKVSGWIDRNERRPVQAAAVAYLPDGGAVSVRLTDISYEGCQVESDEILPIGCRITLALPRLGDIAAQVRWSLHGRAGIRFLLEERQPVTGGEAPAE